MSWMKLNEGLSSLKGQISNFASNVLADDEDSEVKTNDFEQLQQLCIQQKLEIVNLKTINEKLQNKNQLEQIEHNDGISSNGTWQWGSEDAKPTVVNQEDIISDLKNQISLLQNEKNDVLSQLDQLDTENQENLSKVVAMKENIQDELDDLKEKYQKLKQHNKVLLEREENLRKESHDTDSELQGAEKCRILAEKNQKLEIELQESNKQLETLESSYKTLKETFENFRAVHEKQVLENKDTVERLEVENMELISHLQKAKESIQAFEKKSLEDEDNCHKLAVILETYEKQVRTLKDELETLKTQNEMDDTEIQLKLVKTELEEFKSQKSVITEASEKDLQTLKLENSDLRKRNEELQRQVNGRIDIDLEEELGQIRAEHEAQLSILEQEMEQLRINEVKNSAYEDRIQELEDCIKTLRIEICDLEEQNKELSAIHEKVMIQLHDQYVNIITENIKKFQDCEKPSDFQHCSHEEDPRVADFSKQVENIMKILLELKCKCQTLEHKAMCLSEEKNSIITEKNHEIEKLMQNSEILSREVLTKTRAIKEYEKEFSELATNNDLLITDLEAYKNNSVLQTISESNEDNMVLLESQLEYANKRIEDLEKIIDDYEKQMLIKNSSPQEDQIDSAVQVGITGHDISKDYQDLLNSYDHLQIEHDTLKSDLEASRDYLHVINHDKSELKSSLEKLTSDNDILEYQISELNINNDGLKEEIVVYKNEIDNLLKENSKLTFLNEEYKETNDELKKSLEYIEKKLGDVENERSELELQTRTMTEKLQLSKMAETSLKLQCEQKSKEVATLSEANYNLEISLNQYTAELQKLRNEYADLQSSSDKLSKDLEELQKSDAKNLAADELMKKTSVRDDNDIVNNPQNNLETDAQMKDTYEDVNLKVESNNLQTDLNKQIQMEVHLSETLNKCSILQQQLQEITTSRNELIHLVTTKHQESTTYHNEIQRLTQILTAENEKYRSLEGHFNELKSKMATEDLDTMKREMEKVTDQNSFLKEKCEVMAKNLLEEQSKVQQLLTEKSLPSEKEITLQKNLDRLQTHLVELEEHYTQELFQAEQKNASLQARVADIEEREKNSSTIYTSVSIRANQQVESLQKQLQGVVNERDALRKQISDAEDQNTRQAAALANLQFVLEQFRKDKEKDVQIETERIRRQIAVEKQVQEELKKEISGLKAQLDESNQGLQAASRLSDQLENSKKTVSTLKDEVSRLQSKLSKADEDLKAASTHTNEKVDKSLVKNLIIGFVTSNNNHLNKDQSQILKIIATVLDFNQQDHDKLNLNKPPTGSWLGSFLAPESSPQSKLSAESLSQAFVRFLENESKPRAIPNLLPSEATKTSTQSTPRQSPIVLSEIVLPTFADFAQNRNSSSILKDVLKDNTS